MIDLSDSLLKSASDLKKKEPFEIVRHRKVTLVEEFDLTKPKARGIPSPIVFKR